MVKNLFNDTKQKHALSDKFKYISIRRSLV